MAWSLLIAGMAGMQSLESNQAAQLPEPILFPRQQPKEQPAESQEELFFRARDFFAALESDIRQARESICVEMYIWSNDEVGARFYRLLEEAARRGVSVRVVVDGVGSWFWIRAQQARLQAGAARFRIYRPVRWPALFSSGFPRFFSRLNRRNHKKVAVIDGKIAYTGSLNITRRSLAWKECGLRITGPAVPLLQALFEDVWRRSGEEGKAARPARGLTRLLMQSDQVRSNQLHRLRNLHLRDLKQRIRGAQKRVWMMTPYFVPTLGVILALLQAAKRGVDVRLVLPSKSDVWFTRWVAHLYYRFLLKAGVRVYEYLPRILHAKVSLIDDWAFVGSSNLNRRSSHLDLELDIVLRNQRSLRLLAGEFQRDLLQSEEVLRPAPRFSWRNTLARVFYLWRGWL